MSDAAVLAAAQGDLGPLARFRYAAVMGLVAALSLLLLVYVAFGDARRTYERFQTEKLMAEAQALRNAVEEFVRADLPLGQFAGFARLGGSALRADPMLDAIDVLDMAGRTIMSAGGQTVGETMLVVLPIRSRFEEVGLLRLSASGRRLHERVAAAFRPVLWLAAGVLAAFGLLAFLVAPRARAASSRRWAEIGLAAAFVGVAAVIVATLVSLYSEGAQDRARSLARGLGQRLRDVVAYRLDDRDITGLDALFAETRRLNPDLRQAALVSGGRTLAGSDPGSVRAAWQPVGGDHEYAVRLSAAGVAPRIEVRVALPHAVVLAQVVRSVKNFAALLVAAGLFAMLFMDVAARLHRPRPVSGSAEDEAARVALVKPLFFLAVFSDYLCAAFLPQFVESATASAHLPTGFAAVPFAAYYLCFALALVPAGRLEGRVSSRALMILGLGLCASGMALLAACPTPWGILCARGLSGAGQGTILVGVQAYLLAHASPARRTRSGSIVVFGFQAGMLAGIAIGSLLVASVQPAGIFVLAGSVAAIAAVYAGCVIPGGRTARGPSRGRRGVWRDLATLLRDPGFARAMLFVGVPAKAILTGAILFGLPLLLTRQGFAREEIGQMTMLYAAAVMAGAALIAARADRPGGTRTLLFQGTCLTGLGLGLMALTGWWPVVGWQSAPRIALALVVVGAILVGLAHGFINAPVVTHVVAGRAAAEMGVSNVAASYRLFERVGHVLGPVAMAQVFGLFGQSWSALGWIGLLACALGILFLWPRSAER